jgi:4a-hydroxytetrahydrobiopterin dehydratase
MRTPLLSDSEVSDWLAANPDWALADGRSALQATFKFADFPAAIGFMVEVSPTCDELDHHPEWCNVYNRVEVTLATHDSGGVTSLDVAIAERMNEVRQKT